MTSNDLVILFDSVSDIEDLKRNLVKKPKIISFGYTAHAILKNNNIEHSISDVYLTRDELVQIQNRCYELSRWFENKEIAEKISYENINLGASIQTELNYLLVPFVKKFVELEKIVAKFNNADFLVSSTFYQIVLSATTSVTQLDDDKKNDNEFYYDSVKISLNIRSKNLTLKLSRYRYEKLKKIFEGVLDLLFRPRDNKGHRKVLLVEFNPVMYRKFFEAIPASKLNFSIFNRRRPPIWNLQTLSIIRKSNCKIISVPKLINAELEDHVKEQKLIFKEKINSVWKDERYFNSFFSVNGSSFWRFLKSDVIELFNKRALNTIFEILVAKRLFEKHHFSAIIVWSEIGSTEQTLVKIAKGLKIPIILLQHGYFYDSDSSGAYNMNKFQGVFPVEADKYIVWGKIEERHQIIGGIPEKMIEPLGSPQHDRVFDFIEKQGNEYILLATSGPVKENALDLTVETVQKNQDVIKKICQIVSGMNKTLVIKIHPSPDEFDPSYLVQQIDPRIKVVKTGDIASLISNCELFIAIDASTVILDAQLFKKPVISVAVKDSDYGIPSILQDGCLFIDIEDFEGTLRQVLDDDKFRSTIIDKGTRYVNEYLANQGCASTIVLDFVEKITGHDSTDGDSTI